MKSSVIEFMNKHQLLKKNATVLIGVSGGPDSMALLHFYLSIRNEWNLHLIVLSVDHQLRGAESIEDFDFVQNVCEKWDIKFVGASLDVKAYKEDKRVGTQVAAREVRYQFFAQQMEHFKADYLALGHHGDDQVETMLMAFVRSASTSALSGIPLKRPFFGGNIVRPLLCVTKQEINNYCVINKIVPRIDSSNESTEYTRNFFRKNIIPIIKERNNNIHTTVQRLSESLNEDEIFLQEVAKKMFCDIVDLDTGREKASFKIDVFKSYPHALQRRAYHLILDYLYDGFPPNLSYVHEGIFFTLLEDNKANVQIDFPGNLKLERSYELLVFHFQGNNVSNLPLNKILNVPGEIGFSDGSKMTAIYTDNPKEQDEYTYVCAAESVTLPLHIRTRRAGDRMRWKGLDGSKKIKDIFIDAKIPRNKRGTWLIVADNNDEILWLVDLKKGEPQIQARNKSSYIRLYYEKGSL